MIMVDPPWRFANYSSKGEEKNATAHYTCLTMPELKAIPVGDLAGGDCAIWMWATNPMLPQAIELMAAWGFQFKTAGHWTKRTRTGKLAFGTGYILRSAGEPFLIGTVGRPRFSRSVRSVIDAEIREHSRKPEEAYAAAEELVPDVRRADLFSRQSRPGWDSWGDEVGKFA